MYDVYSPCIVVQRKQKRLTEETTDLRTKKEQGNTLMLLPRKFKGFKAINPLNGWLECSIIDVQKHTNINTNTYFTQTYRQINQYRDPGEYEVVTSKMEMTKTYNIKRMRT